jgi:drug/metabolite transporter (DMT)-like permease
MVGTLTSGAIGLLLAGICALKIWKKHNTGKPPGWLALLAGAFASATVLGWLGGLIDYSIAGVGILLFVLVLGGFLFYIEVIKKHHPHPWRTPLVAFAVGIALTASFGGVQHAVNNGTTHLTSVIQHNTGR